MADRYGRKPAQILPTLIAIPLEPLYLLSGNFTLIWWALVIQGAFGSGGFAGQAPAIWLNVSPPEFVPPLPASAITRVQYLAWATSCRCWSERSQQRSASSSRFHSAGDKGQGNHRRCRDRLIFP